MSDTRAPRPTDLVALVTFDEEVRENQAVTREHLGEPREAPRPLAAAIEQWLHIRRRMWISVAGREIRGIATARDLSSKSAWQLDTLIDAPGADPRVIGDLLRQAALAARDAQATHLLLRTPSGSTAAGAAPRAGFRPVVRERLWTGVLAPRGGAGSTHVREAEEADAGALFLNYCRAWPVSAREAMAMTADEWQAVQESRWSDRDEGRVAEYGGRITASLHAAKSGQFSLCVDPEAMDGGFDLLAGLARRHPGEHFALLPAGSAAEEAARASGLRPGAEYDLFCLRIAQPVREEAFTRAGVAIPG